jgi:hypothetical protein
MGLKANQADLSYKRFPFRRIPPRQFSGYVRSILSSLVALKLLLPISRTATPQVVADKHGPANCRKLISAECSFTSGRRSLVSDLKKNVKNGIDTAAEKTKNVAGKAVDKTKDATKSVGDSVKKTGEKVKDAGK